MIQHSFFWKRVCIALYEVNDFLTPTQPLGSVLRAEAEITGVI